MKIITLKSNNPIKKNVILDEIICAVDIHRQAMKFVLIPTIYVYVLYDIHIG